ncbi:MAG: hydrogenase maturation protease [Candidatus Latescibacteria bacterium]|nr:hydrogenase maturation protease [bacterium]MBD3424063.1 hydrogenase maturation protease [Candidatus Latescibacterota bacterium]
MNTVIIGLGNTILSDDGVGVYVARRLRRRLNGSFSVLEAELAGLDLMEMMKDYQRAVIIDAINLEGEEPGTVFRLSNDDIRITPRLASCHDIDLGTAVALGERLGFDMPEEVIIFAVQGEDLLTLGEGCLEAVEKVIPPLVDEIAGMLTGEDFTRISVGLDRRKRKDA